MYASGRKVATIIKMNIGIYDPYLDDLGGGEKYMLTAAECLSKEHNVTIFWDNQHDVTAVARRFHLNLSKCKISKNIFSSTTSTLQRLQATHIYDALIVLSDGSVPLTLSNKLYLHVQQPLSDLPTSGIMENFKRSRITKIFYNSPFTRDRNIGIFGKVPTTVIYPPVTHVSVKSKKENIILHVGRYRPIEGTDNDFKKQSIMLRAFKEMVDEGLKGWKFVLAAGVLAKHEELYAALKKSVKGYPIEFVENSSNKELEHLYAQAKLYWHASGYGEDLEKQPELAEHFGISTVEAMSAGAVPVVINAGGQPEIVTHKENGYVWDSLEDLKELTVRLTEDSKLLEQLSEKAIVRSKDFDTQKFCKDIHSLVI
jgi:glycosyltransferase involved in cell wall biosynthesis